MGQQSESIPALDRGLYAKLREAAITLVIISWSGGSDEGYLDVSLQRAGGEHVSDEADLESELQDWADEAFQYSGAGDGTDYGDDYTYDLVGHTVTHSEWFHQRVEGGSEREPLRLDGSGQQSSPTGDITDPPDPAYAALEKLYGAGVAEEILGRLTDAGLKVQVLST